MNALPEAVWQRLTKLFGNVEVTSRQLQSDTLLAQMTNVGYTYRRVFKLATRNPYKLAQGNVDQNLKTLAAEGVDEYTDLVTRKICHLASIRGT